MPIPIPISTPVPIPMAMTIPISIPIPIPLPLIGPLLMMVGGQENEAEDDRSAADIPTPRPAYAAALLGFGYLARVALGVAVSFN